MGCIFTSAMAMYNIQLAFNSLIQVINSDPISFVDESNKFGDQGNADDLKDDRNQAPSRTIKMMTMDQMITTISVMMVQMTFSTQAMYLLRNSNLIILTKRKMVMVI